MPQKAHSRKNFIARNENFVCQECSHKNTKAKTSYRNHCKNCLFSLHVDQNVPGDRQNLCQGLMRPIAIEHSGKKGLIIVHLCQKCSSRTKNKTMDDDNFESILKILSF